MSSSSAAELADIMAGDVTDIMEGGVSAGAGAIAGNGTGGQPMVTLAPAIGGPPMAGAAWVTTEGTARRS